MAGCTSVNVNVNASSSSGSSGGYFPFAYLPDEQGLLVFSYLDERELLTAARVCTLFRAWAGDRALWRQLVARRGLVPEPGKSWKRVLFEAKGVVPMGYFRKFTDTAFSATSWMIATKVRASTTGTLKGLGLFSFAPRGSVKMALYSSVHREDEPMGNCTSKGRPHLLLAVTHHTKPMDTGRVELMVKEPVAVQKGQDYWIVALYDQQTAFHGKIAKGVTSELEWIQDYADYSDVCEVRWDFHRDFPSQYPADARKRRDTHNYYMCVLPEHTHNLLQTMDTGLSREELIDETDITNYRRMSRQHADTEEGPASEIMEEQDLSANLCANLGLFAKETEQMREKMEVEIADKLQYVAKMVFCPHCAELFVDGWAQLHLHLHTCCSERKAAARAPLLEA